VPRLRSAADDRHLLDVLGVAVELLELVGVDVLAPGRGSSPSCADDVEVASSSIRRGRRCAASRSAASARGLGVLEVAEHDVRAFAINFADAVGIRLIDLDVDARQRPATEPGIDFSPGA